MTDHIRQLILSHTGATDIGRGTRIQGLWSGYGHISRYPLIGSELKSIVLKHVQMPAGGTHPRGWNTDLSHQRKVKSYDVETHWYGAWSSYCDDRCRVPQCLASEAGDGELVILLEDLDPAGYPARRSQIQWPQIQLCLQWLANFHATYLGEKPLGLWETGTYWHLETRPDELAVLDDRALKQHAAQIDQLLKDSPFQTFVHGDAKLANFCFSETGDTVAAVDFQYVGGGCGMKDVAYFVGSCLYEDDCEALEGQILDTYFAELRAALIRKGKDMDPDALEADWRNLYPVAWTDFHRFLKGWSPGHWKINSYSERLAQSVIAQISR
ncbi:phosphotransferase [Pontibacter sp. G13]|uniref:phosphotransferase n=1 Tax=Pontibacter sp. G13 TaxID=3074898 RepID=UPI00288931FF|nr:phosphotransferase [Pontibacter sp. G13]WNJ20008.1 phosphotransferase [Pontibacter sp. G13]